MLAIQASTGANALATADGVRARMAELEQGFPPDITWSVPYDTTPFISASISEVVHTLAEAMLLVFVVMYAGMLGCGLMLLEVKRLRAGGID